jgi:hypothetical protein
METMNDERKGKPSASGMQRIMECAACLPLTNQLRREGKLPEDKGSDEASFGTAVHEILALLALGVMTVGFDQKHVEAALPLWDQAQRFRPDGDARLIVEKRLWFDCGDFSGMFDLVWLMDECAVLIDYKTLHGNHPPAHSNWQLKTGAVLLRQNYGVSSVTAVLLQTMKAPSVAEWSEIDIEDFEAEIQGRLWNRDRDPWRAGFNPNPNLCPHCPARLSCPAHHHLIGQAMATEAITTATTPRLSEFLRACEVVEIHKKAALAEMERRLLMGETDGHFALAPGKTMRKITSVPTLVNRLIAEGVPMKDALSAMSMSVGDAEKLLKSATGLKGGEFAEKMREISEGCIEKPEPELKLKRI